MRKLQKDISASKNGPLTYSSSGVDLDAAGQAIKLIKKPVFSTFNENVLNDLTSYAGLFKLDWQKYKEPVLVSSTDGVGTKLLVAKHTGNYRTIGQDLVAMCINDIICCGAIPLFFLDYIAWGKLDPSKAEIIVGSIARSCIKCQTALIGGEMAEMPDMYAADDIDLAGFAVGIVEKQEIIKTDMVQKGDILIGIPSSGVHSNGFSLVRKIIETKGLRFDDEFALDSQKGKTGKDPDEEINRGTLKKKYKTLGDVLMEPTKLYFPVANLLKEKGIKVNGMAHITGGGFYENINRIIPENMNVSIEEGSWPIPDIFKYLGTHGNLKKDEMYRVFNMGIGLVLILAPGLINQAIDELKKLKEKAYIIGEVAGGTGKVTINYRS